MMPTSGVFCCVAWSFQILLLDRLTADEEAESQKAGHDEDDVDG